MKEHAGFVMMLVSFAFFGWLIHKQLEKEISTPAAWLVVNVTATLQLCIESTFDFIQPGYMFASLCLFFLAILMMLLLPAKSREPWAEEDRAIKKINDVVGPFG